MVSTTGSGSGTVYHYDITVNSTGTTSIGTFWFAWLPGQDFLPSAPLTEASPSGWGAAVTGTHDQSDGSAIEWTTTTSPIAPGDSLSGFDFTSPDSPAALAGQSPTHPIYAAMLSTIYNGMPLSSDVSEFTVAPAVTTAASTTAVTASQSTINHGDSVTFTAAVSGSGSTPTGTVTFLEDGTSMGTGQLQNGSATVTTSTLPAGALSITAQYGGDSNFSSSTSPAITETVNPPAPTTTTLATSNPSVLAGASVTLTATVAPVTPGGQTPSGTVTFTDNGATLGTMTVGSDGTAALATTALPVGSDQITATYSGDNAFATSTSSPTTETVAAGTSPTTTSLTASSASSAAGASVSFTATVAPVTPGGAAPTGTVTFTQDGTSIGSAAVASDGTAVLAITSLPVGADAITAAYSGDANYAGSTSATFTETVANPATLTPTIVKSTLPSALVGGTAAHGSATLSIANTTASAIKGKVTIQLFATTDGTIDGSAIQLAQVVRGVNVKTIKPSTTAVPVKIAAGTLPAGAYSLVARVIDLSNNNGDSAAGPTLTVVAPFVSLSETFTKMTIPASAVAGAKSHAVLAVRIANGGNIITPGTTTVTAFASLSGVVDSSAIQIASATKPLRIHPGKFSTLTFHLKQIPTIAAGNYTILVQATDGNGGISTSVGGIVNITT
ncbi:MAG TPA: Ig-like domain-containing protein [Tepidisphaeraceae bacterium]|nr:Ig-like domain-containing protein [Tepidisphaeraceae bacterium]